MNRRMRRLSYMKTIKCLLLAVFAAFFIQSVAQAKPDGVGKADMPSINKKEQMNDKAPDKVKRADDDADDELEAKKEKVKEKKEKAKQEKEKAEKEAKEDAEETLKEKSNMKDKTNAIRKEEGSGSEQGQAKRAENSRKWWKFWGD